MKSLEIKNFSDYCMSLLEISSINNKMNVKFSYNDGVLVETNNKKGFSRNYLPCNKFDYEKITTKICQALIKNSTDIKFSISKGNLVIDSNEASINLEVASMEQFFMIKNCQSIKKDYSLDNKPTFEKIANLISIYKIFIKNCSSKNGKFEIYPYYKDNHLNLEILENGVIVFFSQVRCTQEEANKAISKLVEDFTTNHNIKYTNKSETSLYTIYSLGNRKFTFNFTDNNKDFAKIFEINEKVKRFSLTSNR